MTQQISAAAERAIRTFTKDKGPSIRTTGERYRKYCEAIASADDPSKEASKILKQLHKAKEEEPTSKFYKAIRKIYEENGGLIIEEGVVLQNDVTTRTLDALTSYLKKGYRSPYLDPIHSKNLDAYEETIFAGTATFETLLVLAEKLITLSTFEPKRNTWHEFKIT